MKREISFSFIVSKNEPLEKSSLEKASDGVDAKIDDLAARLAEKIKAKRGTLNSGIDPELLMLGAELD